MDTKVCPFCAEDVKPAAIVCKHCGRDLPNDAPSAESELGATGAKREATPQETRNGWVAIAVMIALIVVGASFCSDGEEAAVTREPPQPAAGPRDSATQQVVYRVQGVGVADVTISNASGDTEQRTVSLPFEQVLMMRTGEFVYLSAQKLSDTAREISCFIRVDGQLVAEASSSARFGIATCSD